jgi:hypothetical protein
VGDRLLKLGMEKVRNVAAWVIKSFWLEFLQIIGFVVDLKGVFFHCFYGNVFFK